VLSRIEEKRTRACVSAARSVAGMVLSSTIDGEPLANEVHEVARSFASTAVCNRQTIHAQSTELVDKEIYTKKLALCRCRKNRENPKHLPSTGIFIFEWLY